MARKPNHEFTREEQAKGGKARAEKLRAEREAAREEIDARAAGLVDLALDRLEALLRSDDPAGWPRAIREVLDRVAGRAPVRVEHSGEIRHRPDLSKLTATERATLRRLAKKLSDDDPR